MCAFTRHFTCERHIFMCCLASFSGKHGDRESCILQMTRFFQFTLQYYHSLQGVNSTFVRNCHVTSLPREREFWYKDTKWFGLQLRAKAETSQTEVLVFHIGWNISLFSCTSLYLNLRAISNYLQTQSHEWLRSTWSRKSNQNPGK